MSSTKRNVSSSRAVGYVCVSVEYSLALSLAPLSRTAALEQGCLGVWVSRRHGDDRQMDKKPRTVVDLTVLSSDDSDNEMKAPVLEEQSAGRLLCRRSAQVQLVERANNIAVAIVANYRPCTARARNTTFICGALLPPNSVFEPMTVTCGKCGGHVCFGCHSATDANADKTDLIHVAGCSLIHAPGEIPDVSDELLAEAQMRAMFIVQAESEWMHQVMERLRAFIHLHTDLWNLVAGYLTSPGRWSMSFRDS